MAIEIIQRQSILEIGPFTNPLITGAKEKTKYFDVMNKKQLIERATNLGRPTDKAVHIDFYDSNGNLSIVTETFDTIVSSHCIEHQPDLITHLRSVSEILQPNGLYYVICPDKRYCFDHFTAESKTIDILIANKEKRTRHTLQNVVEHSTIVTHNNPKRHWDGDHGKMHYTKHGKKIIEDIFERFDKAGNAYIDVHAWKFSPNSFANIINELYDFGYTDLKVKTIYPTPRNRFEFIAILTKIE